MDKKRFDITLRGETEAGFSFTATVLHRTSEVWLHETSRYVPVAVDLSNVVPGDFVPGLGTVTSMHVKQRSLLFSDKYERHND